MEKLEIKILDAKFITSAPNIKLVPDLGVSEVAFIGRSNVGKSSLINALCGRAGLAKSSSTPGKTQLINLFELRLNIGGEAANLVFADLPGFGYARVSKGLKEAWGRSLDEFLRQRMAVRVFVHLVDARHPDLPADSEVAEYLEGIKRPDQAILRLYTKADKLGQKERQAVLKSELAQRSGVRPILVSASKKSGINEAWTAIWLAARGV